MFGITYLCVIFLPSSVLILVTDMHIELVYLWYDFVYTALCYKRISLVDIYHSRYIKFQDHV